MMGTVMDKSRSWYRLPDYTNDQRRLFFVLGLFLSDPYGFAEGYAPLMNHSFPFISTKIPGMAPYDNPYSPDRIPQCIRLEYDPATGKYRQVMVDWKEYQKNMSLRFTNNSYNNAPVPRVAVTPVERVMP